MASEEYIRKMKLLINPDGKYSEEKTTRMAIALLNFYKIINRIMKYPNYTQNQQNLSVKKK